MRTWRVVGGCVVVTLVAGWWNSSLLVHAAQSAQVAGASSTHPAEPSPESWQTRATQLLQPFTPLDEATKGKLKAAVRATSATERVVDRAAVLKALKGRHPLQLVHEVAFIPEKTPGRSLGIKLLWLEKTGVLKHCGLQEGDIIRSVNGQSLSDPVKAMALPAQLQGAPSIDVEVERGGRSMRLSYRM